MRPKPRLEDGKRVPSLSPQPPSTFKNQRLPPSPTPANRLCNRQMPPPTASLPNSHRFLSGPCTRAPQTPCPLHHSLPPSAGFFSVACEHSLVPTRGPRLTPALVWGGGGGFVWVRVGFTAHQCSKANIKAFVRVLNTICNVGPATLRLCQCPHPFERNMAPWPGPLACLNGGGGGG